ncbi:hypothetical protein PC129_g14734 [Phytophthora cactorum]|uniref:Uncharacterized protein n=1 Tax=Phytophthora cactorum TaxID=29920 RepID=A0A329RQK0_9STRA|nr:hypothetical protein Pcac1_g11751 [Phytophthora cactorum]KAG2809598.1 hypothetical protein PC112_g16428 [Phytophthora cactorum]KAG2811163.1 hypothetical protein PC111_g15341 [Phytophthora cactorum]KAG2850759.1 hypothetical protein PC113_g16489 [Phytophthora cactorum]KAG2889221.1 hypothetical protein PC114_g18050 [Phytophthora cactorum]
MCNGTNIRGGPCGTKFGLDADGYCDQHRANTRRCLGIKKNGEQCENRGRKTHANGYCNYHKSQAPGRTLFVPEYDLARCRGIATSTAQRCLKDFDMHSNGYCCYHQHQVPIARPGKRTTFTPNPVALRFAEQVEKHRCRRGRGRSYTC